MDYISGMLVISYVFKSKFFLRFNTLGICYICQLLLVYCILCYKFLVDDSNFLHVNYVLKDDLLLIGWTMMDSKVI